MAEKARKTAEEQSEKWQKQAENLEKKLETESQEWRKQTDQLGKQMVVATDKLDPVGIKELFRDYKELKLLNEQLEATLAAASAADGTSLAGISDLKIELLRPRGTAVLGAYIDEEKDPIFEVHLQSAPPSLNIQFDLANAMCEDFRRRVTANTSALDPILFSAPANEHGIPLRGAQIGNPEAGDVWHQNNQRIAFALMQSRRDIDNAYAKAVGAGLRFRNKIGSVPETSRPERLGSEAFAPRCGAPLDPVYYQQRVPGLRSDGRPSGGIPRRKVR